MAGHAADLRTLMAQEQLARLRRGDTRPVIPEDLVSNIVRPDDFELPATSIPKARRPLPKEEASRSGINVPRGLSSNLVPDDAVERPDEIGVTGKASAKVDIRALMRGAGMGRSRARHDD